MYVTGSGTIGDLLGDLVAYRSLRPCDERLADVPIPSIAPRKIEPEYARVVAALLQRARDLEAPGVEIRRIIVVGDNPPSDGAAFEHLCALTGWQGTALIVDERPAPGHPESPDAGEAQPPSTEQPQLLLSHWSQLREWAHSDAGKGIDERTVVLLDIDKTLLGARGRNDAVIDDARGVAMRATVAAKLGPAFDGEAFDRARQTFNAREFHKLTGDNQDYVAYMCLVVAGGVFSTDEFQAAIMRGEITSIAQLVAAVETAAGAGAQRLRAAHAVVAERIAAGDPTPFKEFREREYAETVGRMGQVAPMNIEERLRMELVLTGEVLDVARQWQSQGALIFALSDKPDEAALPSPELRQQGYHPLHWTATHIIDSRP